MKKAFFPLLICGLMIACAPDNTTKKSTNDPIENLIAYLDGQDEQYANRSIEYEGGRFLKTTVNYFIFANKPASVAISSSGMRRAEKIFRAREEVIDSCFRAFRWGCSSARQCYHKENHVMDKDTVLYALGLDALDGEKIELEGVGSNDYLFMAHYKAARAATMKYRADKEGVAATIEYIVREETGKEEEPLDMTPIMDFIKKKVADTDSVQVYETSYECSAEDWNTVHAIILVRGKEDSRDGITKGHLYVFPEADSRHIQDEFTRYVKDKYLSKYGRCNQKFTIFMDHTYTGETLNIWPSPLMTGEIRSNLLYSGLSQDGKFHILVLDECHGAFFLPSSWKHLIRFQNHKPEYIPGTENRDEWD
jgi:hypothetical protein